jgi:hypothetical protein
MFGTLLISLVGQWVISEYLAYLLPISFNEATIIFHAMLVIWLVQTWVKLVNYPITGKAIGLVKLHRLAPWILVIHLGFIIFWFAKSGTLDSFVIYFLAASIIQLIILINAVIIKYYID